VDTDNKALHRTAIPLRSISAGELGRWTNISSTIELRWLWQHLQGGRATNVVTVSSGQNIMEALHQIVQNAEVEIPRELKLYL